MPTFLHQTHLPSSHHGRLRGRGAVHVDVISKQRQRYIPGLLDDQLGVFFANRKPHRQDEGPFTTRGQRLAQHEKTFDKNPNTYGRPLG